MSTERPDWLIDTNVLLYPYDIRYPEKAKRALEVIERLGASRSGAVSAQILSEWFSVVTRKKPHFSLPVADAVDVLLGFVNYWRVYELTGVTVAAGARCVERYRLAPYDACIWATAHMNGVPFILSEDFNAGQVLDGVTFLNPFADGFDLDALGPAVA
jgi:predicted nucleic acid-binding protein